MNSPAFQELMAIRGLPLDSGEVTIAGSDPVLSSRFKLGETAASVFAATGVALSDLWALRTGRRQKVNIDVSHAAATLRSYQYLKLDNPEIMQAWQAQRHRQMISTPHPTKDGRHFLAHMGLPHLAERALDILGCAFELDAVVNAIARWDALELEEAIAAAKGCGAMVRSEAEWKAHDQGRALSLKPVIEIEKIGESDPEPPGEGERPLTGTRVLDLTRILAGPTCARTLAEHGADVLMVTAEHLPQSQFFVMDTGHGKRSSFLDIQKIDDAERLNVLVRQADVFSQGYRPGRLAARGFSPEELAEKRPGIIYVSMNCYGFDGPFRERAGWEQLAQTVTGIAYEQGEAQANNRPTLLPAAACDYLTGYLAAYGTLLALGRRAREGGSWHVKASLCQSGMFLQRQERVDYPEENMDIDTHTLNDIRISSDTAYGKMQHLGPVLQMSETPGRWPLPTVPLGTHAPEW